MARRLIHHYAIKARRDGPLGIVAPEDFELTLRATSLAPTLPPGALAYCADLARERVLFTCHAHEDLPRLFVAPFLFVEQARTAGSVLSVPFERLDELGLRKGASTPVLVFSPGRAGTTLLARLLGVVGLACASEPDMLTQAVCLEDAQLLGLPPGMDRALASVCMESLGRVLGRGAFLKLRSQCNARPLTLTEGGPWSRVIFVLREARSWAASRHRVFQEPPNHVALMLRQAMDALDTLLKADVQMDIVWFETMIRDPMAALRICAPEVQPNAAAIAAVMARDSQGGTSLARDRVGSAEAGEGFWPAFVAYWHGARATADWGIRTRELLAQMGLA